MQYEKQQVNVFTINECTPTTLYIQEGEKMDEKDKELQQLRRRLKVISEENDALMGELYALKECSTCVHYEERQNHCKGLSNMWCPDTDGYKWRGVKGYDEWVSQQQALARLEKEVAEEEKKFERVWNG